MKKNIFLTGKHSAGKTAVIKQVIESLDVPANGFYTEEEMAGSSRVGFVIKTLDGRQGHLAHKEMKSVCRIRKYGISISNIADIAAPSIAPIEGNVVIFDGIGKMECFSKVFRRAVIDVLDSSNIVIATIDPGGDDFIMEIWNRKDVEIHEVTWNNRKLLPVYLLDRISEFLRRSGKKFPSTHGQMENTAV